MQRFYPFLFVFLWSTGFIGAKYGLPYAEPLSFLLTRYGLVIGLMGLIALATRAPWPKKPVQWLHIGISGLLVHAVYLGGVFVAIKHGLPAGGEPCDCDSSQQIRALSDFLGAASRHVRKLF